MGVDKIESSVRMAFVDGRKGRATNRSPIRSKLSDRWGRATGATARPEKTDCAARRQPGSGTAKAVITSRAVTVHASTPVTPSQESAARA